MNDLWKNNLRDIEPYVPGEQSKEKDIVRLNANENPYPPSPNAVEAIKNIEETEELGSWTKELMKPENMIGPFNSTEEMMKSLLDEE